MKRKSDEKMTPVERSRKAGRACMRMHGSEFYERIGKKGGEKTSATRGHAHYLKMGEKGGEAMRKRGHAYFVRIGRKGGKNKMGYRKDFDEERRMKKW